jgi:signal transduction histidine kinase
MASEFAFTGHSWNATAKPAIHAKLAIEATPAESQLAAEKRLLEMVASGSALAEVLSALCRFVEAACAGCYCGVYLIDWKGPRLRKGAAPSLPAAFSDAMCGLPVRCESTPCARAVHLRTQVIVQDLEADPLWQMSPFRSLASAHALKSCCSTPIYSSAGHVLGTLAILQCKSAGPTPVQQHLFDRMTHIARIGIERAQGDTALRRSEAFLAEAQRLTAAGSFSWRVPSGEISWSEQLYRIFEFDQGVQLTLELIRSRVPSEDLPSVNGMIHRARAAAADFEYEHRLVMPDRSIKYLHLVAHATRDQDGQLEYIGAVQDVTQRRVAEEALGKARSELAHVARIMSLGALTASIAHEVNQPLSGIVTNASTCLRLLAADPPDIDGARETARRTLRDGNRASDVITRLRALFAKKTATSDVVDLNEAAREVIALSLSDLQRRRIILRSELADELPFVAGDRVQLQQVILNLLLNAADAMSGVEDRARQLVIGTEKEGCDRVRLRVQDAGAGFGPHDPKIFEPFYTTKSDGMGIGLSVSRFIIESHHGRLWAEQNDGPGATFSFAIPCSRQ